MSWKLILKDINAQASCLTLVIGTCMYMCPGGGS